MHRLFLLAFIPLASFGQTDSTMLRILPDGAYATYQDLVNETPKVDGQTLLRYLGATSDENKILLPNDDFDNFLGVVLNGQFYINYFYNSKKLQGGNPLLLVGSIARNTITPYQRIFARVPRFGAIGLTSLNSCYKFPSRINFPISVKTIKNFLKDDPELYDAFKRSKEKEIALFRYVDLYNKKHSAFSMKYPD